MAFSILPRDGFAPGLTEAQRAFVERLKDLYPPAGKVGELARWFRKLVNERRPA